MSGEGMPEDMGADLGPKPALPGMITEHLPNALTGERLAPPGQEKDLGWLFLEPQPRLREIPPCQRGCRLAQRNAPLLAAFAATDHIAVVQVDVAGTKLNKLPQ